MIRRWPFPDDHDRTTRDPPVGTDDSAYGADPIHAHSRELNHVPIIAVHARRGIKKPSQVPKVFPDQPTPQLTWAQEDRFKTRTMIERVNARLKDESGASQIRVRGVKVMAYLMFECSP